MAALHIAPAPITDAITIQEGVALLAPTGHPMTYRQLADRLDAAGTPRERDGRRFRYSASDVLEIHRDLVDGGLLD